MEFKNKILFNSILQIDKINFSRCLEPSLQCTKSAIHAHSIQNSNILSQLVKDGHVIGLVRSANLNKGITIDFASIGRNKATTFTGLCSQHDYKIFSPIETNVIDLENKEHLFLLAYRSAYRELHATMEGAVKLQCGYKKRVEQGLDSKDYPSQSGLNAIERMMVSYETYCYKSILDEAYIKKDFTKMAHDVICFDVDKPTIAVCSLFSVDHIKVRDNILRIHLNILPLKPLKTAVIFSYLYSDASLARFYLNRILQSQGLLQKYELSRLILNSCENFVISPFYFETWTKEKKELIRDYFVQTILNNNFNLDSPELILF